MAVAEFKTEQEFRRHLSATEYGKRILDIFDKYAEGHETKYNTDNLGDLVVLEGDDSSLSLSLMDEGKRAQILFDLYGCLAEPHFKLWVNLETGHARYGVGREVDPELDYVTGFLDRVTRLGGLKAELLGFASDEDVF